MNNKEIQARKFVDYFCKATGLDRCFGYEIFSYLYFYRSVKNMSNAYDKILGWQGFTHVYDENNIPVPAFGGENGILSFVEIEKLYKEIVAE